MADISATAGLNATQYSRGLRDALQEARQFKSRMESTLKFDPFQRVNKSLTDFQTKLGKTRTVKLQIDDRGAEQKIRRTGQAINDTSTSAARASREVSDLNAAIKANATQVRNLTLAYNNGQVSTESFVRQMTALRNTSQGLSSGLDQDSADLLRLNQTIKTANTGLAKAGAEYDTLAQAVIYYRIQSEQLRNAIEDRTISEREGIRLTEQLQREIREILADQKQWTNETKQLRVASGRLARTQATLEGRTTKLGLSQNVAIGTTGRLTNAYQGLAGAVTAAVAALGLQRGARALTAWSAEAATARNAASLFYDQLARGNQSVTQATSLVDRLADEFETTADAVQGSATLLLRSGASLEQIEDILRGAGASAVFFGRRSEEGFQNAAQAFVSGRSTLLNSIGISKDLSVAYREMARELGTTVENLKESDKALAFQRLILGETKGEVEGLTTVMRSFVGAQQRASTELKEFRRSVGQGSEAFLTPLINAGARLLSVFNALPGPIKTATVFFAALTTTLTGVAVAYTTIRAALARAQIVQSIVTGLVEREAASRSVLGGMLLRLAGRYGLLTREQARNTVAARRNAGAVTVQSAALQGLRTAAGRAVTGIKALTVASLRFIATPIGAALVLIVGTIALLTKAARENQQILEPAFRAVKRAIDAFGQAFGPVTKAVASLFEEGSVLANFMRGTLARAAQGLAITIIALAEAYENAANAFAFYSDVIAKGPVQAFRDAQARAEATRQKYAELRGEVHEATRAAIAGEDGMNGLADGTENAGDEAERTAEELAALRREAEATADTFQNRFADIRLSLMPQGEAKDIAEARAEFQALREEIRKAAEENDQFAPLAQGLLSESYRLEQGRISQIQDEYAQERQEAAEKEAADLAKAIEDRERAIVELKTQGLESETERTTAEYEQRRSEAERLYDDLITDAAGYTEEIEELQALKAENLLEIDRAYERDVKAIYDRLYTDLTERERQFERDRLEAQGDPRSLLAFDFQSDLRESEQFYEELRVTAGDNAAALTAIDKREAQNRTDIWEAYWAEITALANDQAAEIEDRQASVDQRQAELAGDAAQVARIEAARSLREVHAYYDQLEKAAGGNASELRRIAALRNEEVTLLNEELARELQEIDAEVNFQPVVDALLEGLGEADRATTQSIRNQLVSWRTAYGGNAAVASIINQALGQVEDRYEQLTAEVSQSIDQLIDRTSELGEALAAEDATRNASEIETTYQQAAERTAEVREEITALTAALADASEEQTSQIMANINALTAGLNVIERAAVEDARRIATNAIQAYADGIEQARREASDQATQIVQEDIARVLGGIAAVQTNALQEARSEILSTIAGLRIDGFDEASLQVLKDQMGEIDELLAQTARNTADFAADQFQHLRTVANAVLSEVDAQRVATQTYQRMIELRREALQEVEREEAGLDEVTRATQELTGAQLEYLGHLQDQVQGLRELRGEYLDVFGAVSDLSDLLGVAVPQESIDAQRELALAAFENVRAQQASGASFAEYKGDLEEATQLWNDFEGAASSALDAAFADVQTRFEDNDLSDADLQAFQDLAQRIADTFGVSLDDARSRINQVLRGVVDEPLQGLTIANPEVMSEVLDNLNAAAADTPGVLQEVETEITRLEAEVAALKATIADAVNFDAAAEQLVSGYEAVLDQIAATTGETFDQAAVQAVAAFLRRLEAEHERLKEELEDQIGGAAAAAGLTAGQGLMEAFATGITQNDEVLLEAVDAVLADVRARLPSSDAKKGHLKDLTASGRTLFPTWFGGVKKGASVLGRIDGLLAKAMPNPAVRFAGGAGLAGAGAVGGAGPTIGTLNIDGRPQAPTPAMLALQAKQMARVAAHELTRQGIVRRR